jgi:hypothetical protein
MHPSSEVQRHAFGDFLLPATTPTLRERPASQSMRLGAARMSQSTSCKESGNEFRKEHDRFKPYINDGRTVVVSLHKVFGPQTNDLVLQLRKRKISKIILGGMLANMCVEAHLRDLLEQGFEVCVVKDAVAGPRHPVWGDGYAAAMVNFQFSRFPSRPERANAPDQTAPMGRHVQRSRIRRFSPACAGAAGTAQQISASPAPTLNEGACR